jgi:hypothetical protein
MKASIKYNHLRSRLVRRGYTLRSWAMDRGLPVGSVYSAVKRLRNGVRATHIQQQLEKFLNEN